MVRPLKADRESICSTHVRVSLKTKRLLDKLVIKHGCNNIDSVLQYYLPTSPEADKPVFHTAKEVYNMTYRQPFDKLIKSASAEIMRKSRSGRQINLP